VNACGVDDLHDGANVIRTAVVVGTSKARETLEPFLGQLGRRLAHVMSRMLPISMYLLQKDGTLLGFPAAMQAICAAGLIRRVVSCCMQPMSTCSACLWYRAHMARYSVCLVSDTNQRRHGATLSGVFTPSCNMQQRLVLCRAVPDRTRSLPEEGWGVVCGLHPADRDGCAVQMQGGSHVHHPLHHLVPSHPQRLRPPQHNRGCAPPLPASPACLHFLVSADSVLKRFRPINKACQRSAQHIFRLPFGARFGALESVIASSPGSTISCIPLQLPYAPFHGSSTRQHSRQVAACPIPPCILRCSCHHRLLHEKQSLHFSSFAQHSRPCKLSRAV
jgi:hypothetical protein